MPSPILESARGLDLSPRIFRTSTVVGSPAAASETIIATVTIDSDLAVGAGVLLMGFCTLTVGTSGTAITTKIRRTDTSGATVVTSGATTAAAGNLVDRSIVGFDTGPVGSQVYVMTLTITAGAAASTVTAVQFAALVV